MKRSLIVSTGASMRIMQKTKAEGKELKLVPHLPTPDLHVELKGRTRSSAFPESPRLSCSSCPTPRQPSIP